MARDVGEIRIKGARQHNLKNIDVVIPRGTLTVITGVSGSGKSSLAFDTLYAEGQRRYVESLSAYARQFLGVMQKPDVDMIEGLSPAISIEQKTVSKNPRSTVATITEIYDYLRLLFASIGIPHCPNCNIRIERQTAESIVEQVLKYPKGTKLLILAPVIKGKKGEHKKLMEKLRKDGYVRVIIDGEMMTLAEIPQLDKNKKHSIEVVIDRINMKEGMESRITDSVEAALGLGEGTIIIQDVKTKNQVVYSEHLACIKCGYSIGELLPRNFSFNSPFGACPECDGLGYKLRIDPDLLIPDKNLTMREGAITGRPLEEGSWRYYYWKTIAEHLGFTIDTPIRNLTPEQYEALLYGTNERIPIHVKGKSSSSEWKGHITVEGLVNIIKRRHRETSSEGMRDRYQSFMRELPCNECQGQRLRKEFLSVYVQGKNIHDITEMSIEQASRFFAELNDKLTEKERQIAGLVIKEIQQRLKFLLSVGLNYLTLSRRSGTLSGGEAQRIRLATQIGSALVGIMYILDEPSIGLHPRDRNRLIQSLLHLRDIGNTVIVVEHDEDTIRAADWVIDLGPGAGDHGGSVVYMGPLEGLLNHDISPTGQHLSGRKRIPIPRKRRTPNGNALIIRGARANNLKNIDVKFPLGLFICVTGVSGSGKSTLVTETLYKALNRHLHGSKDIPGEHDRIDGLKHVDKVIAIDQSPIGRTPRSNPATYTKVFDLIRELFSKTQRARVRGYKPGRFSFNVKGGRCEVCEGAGEIKIELHFLPDVHVPCDACKGTRFNRETLEITYKGKNIAEVLDMTVDTAYEFFNDIPKIKSKLQLLRDTGLGYLKLGQPSTTLSGGESQRIKITRELSKRSTGRTVYILDEPTTGLSFHDINHLIKVLQRLTDGGNTVIVIEHNLDVVKCADWVIDLGPDGGDNGGQIVAEGPPEMIAKDPRSITGKYLSTILERDKSSIKRL